MIQVIEFGEDPILPGQSRRLVLDGDGPFTVSTSCFVVNPPPPGFRPCPQCSTTTVSAHQALRIEVSTQFRTGKSGKLGIEITDAIGETVTLELNVIPDTDASPTALAGAC
jgi:hypothetical protein